MGESVGIAFEKIVFYCQYEELDKTETDIIIQKIFHIFDLFKGKKIIKD